MKEKIKYAIFHGTGFVPQEDKYTISIANKMPQDFEVHLISYYKKEEIQGIDDEQVISHWIYSEEYYQKDLKKEQMEELENWLGIPFLLIAKYVHRYSDRRYRDKMNNIEFESRIYQYIAEHVNAWKNFFEKNKIEAFTGFLEPKVVETTGNAVAQRLGIKISNLVCGRITNTMMIYNSDWSPLFWKKTPPDKIEQYYNYFVNRYSNRKEPEADQVLKDFSQKKSGLRVIRNLIKEYANHDRAHKTDNLRYATAWDRVPRRIFDKRIRMLLSQFFYTRKFEFEKERYFFFPLHFVEESTLSIKETFLNQYNIIEAIAWSLPENVKLIVKPHPHWCGSDIELTNLAKAKKNKKIVVVPHDENPYRIIRNSIGVIIINSTSGMEAIALGKPLIVFGHDMYERPGASIVIRDNKELPSAINNCIKNPGKTYDLQARKELLSDYYNHSIFLEGKIGATIELTENDTTKVAKELSECTRVQITKNEKNS
ncbi:hypothetical protein HY990_03545 [Candidatus Micrarchaeota archaeon]|nr:hypothetical protein [Candidatus Micrarchaeota archaeon]